MVFKVKSAALDCCRLLSREKGGLNEAVTQVSIWILAVLYNIVFQEMLTLVLYGRYSDTPKRLKYVKPMLGEYTLT